MRPSCEHIPSVEADMSGWRVLIPREDSSCTDLLGGIMDSEPFAFLRDPEEDVYTLDDGEPIR